MSTDREIVQGHINAIERGEEDATRLEYWRAQLAAMDRKTDDVVWVVRRIVNVSTGAGIDLGTVRAIDDDSARARVADYLHKIGSEITTFSVFAPSYHDLNDADISHLPRLDAIDMAAPSIAPEHAFVDNGVETVLTADQFKVCVDAGLFYTCDDCSSCTRVIGHSNPNREDDAEKFLDILFPSA